MDVNELAKALFGKDARTNLLNSSPGATTTVYGTAMSDSENGEVQVFISDDAVGSDFGAEPDATVVTLPTSPAVKMGDTVAVTLLGGNTVKHPYVSAVIGSGDETRSLAETASTLSDEAITIAEHIANLTGQYFWYDDDGAHITEIPESEWTDETSPNYHAGHNVLITSEGQLFRIAQAVMLGIYESGVDIYDGKGTTEFNSLTSIKPANVRVGPQLSNNFNANETEVSLQAGYNDVFSVQYNKLQGKLVTVAGFHNPGGYYYDTMVATFVNEANYRGWHPSSTTVGDTNVDILDSNNNPTGYTLSTVYQTYAEPVLNPYGKVVSSSDIGCLYSITNQQFETEAIFDNTNTHKVQLGLSENVRLLASNDSLYISAPGMSDYFDTPSQGFGIGAYNILIGGPLIGDQSSTSAVADSIRIRGPVRMSDGNFTLYDGSANRLYVVRSPEVDSDSSTAPSSWKRAGGLELHDKDDDVVGRFQSVWGTNNAIGVNVETRRVVPSTGTAVENFLRVWVTDSGSQTYSVASPANFRSAIGLGTDIAWTHLAGPAESSLPSGTSDRNGVWYRRKHNMVEVQLVTGGTWSNGKTWNTSAQTIATLPSGCRPGIPIHDTGNVPGANTVGQVIVSTDGTIQIQLGSGSSKYFRAHFMFTV